MSDNSTPNVLLRSEGRDGRSRVGSPIEEE
jgi:hypothetical protein